MVDFTSTKEGVTINLVEGPIKFTPLKSLFSALVRSESDLVSLKVAAVISRLSHKSYAKGSSEELLFQRLDSQFPGGDIGICIFNIRNVL
jgi:hypothetical protein